MSLEKEFTVMIMSRDGVVLPCNSEGGIIPITIKVNSFNNLELKVQEATKHLVVFLHNEENEEIVRLSPSSDPFEYPDDLLDEHYYFMKSVVKHKTEKCGSVLPRSRSESSEVTIFWIIPRPEDYPLSLSMCKDWKIKILQIDVTRPKTEILWVMGRKGEIVGFYNSTKGFMKIPQS